MRSLLTNSIRLNESINPRGILTNDLWDDIIESIIDDVDITRNEIINMSPEEFNDGFCDYFADTIFENVEGMMHISSDEIADEYNIIVPPHAWVSDGKKEYDMEALDGVDSWEDLPIFKRWKKSFAGFKKNVK